MTQINIFDSFSHSPRRLHDCQRSQSLPWPLFRVIRPPRLVRAQIEAGERSLAAISWRMILLIPASNRNIPKEMNARPERRLNNLAAGKFPSGRKARQRPSVELQLKPSPCKTVQVEIGVKSERSQTAARRVAARACQHKNRGSIALRAI